MPLYEGIALIQEKQAVVLDIGTVYTKFGFTGESSPRCIIQTQYLCPRTKTVKRLEDFETEEDLYIFFVELLHILYFKHVLVNPKDRKVVVVESLLCPTLFRETLAKVLFCQYEVSSVLFAPSAMSCCVTLGTPCALVLEIGYHEAVATPVAHGYVLPHDLTAQPAAAHSVHQALRVLLDEDNKVQLNLSDKIIEDIKVRTCFVTSLERAQAYQNSQAPSPPPSVSYPLPPASVEGGNPPVLNISGKTREMAAEAMFPRDNDHTGLADVVLNCIMKCPIDIRKPLAENILITGGTAMLPGIKSRLAQELRYLIHQPPYAGRIHIFDFKFHTAPAKENYTAWLGGAILGATDAINTRSLTREAYARDRRVKDWVNLLDNTSPKNGHWSGMSL